MSGGVEQYFARARTLDLEEEAGIIAPSELEIASRFARAVCYVRVRRQVRIKQVKGLVLWCQVCGHDPYSKSLLALVLNGEGQIYDIDAIPVVFSGET